MDVKAIADFALVQDQLFARVSGVEKRTDGYGAYLDYTCYQKLKARRRTPVSVTVSARTGPRAARLDGQPDVVPVGSAADNAFSLPQSVDPKAGPVVSSDLSTARIHGWTGAVALLPSEALEINLSADYTSKVSDPTGKPAVLALQDDIINNTYDTARVPEIRHSLRHGNTSWLSPTPYTNFATRRRGHRPGLRSGSAAESGDTSAPPITRSRTISA